MEAFANVEIDQLLEEQGADVITLHFGVGATAVRASVSYGAWFMKSDRDGADRGVGL